MNDKLTLSDQERVVEEALRQKLGLVNTGDTYHYLRTWVYSDMVIYQKEREAAFHQRGYSWGADGEVVIGDQESEVAQVWVATNAGAQSAAMNTLIRAAVGRRA